MKIEVRHKLETELKDTEVLKLTTEDGNIFRVNYSSIYGLVINKTTENGETETLRIIPRCSNEISLY